MRLSLRDLTTAELETLLAEVLQAIELAEHPVLLAPAPECAPDTPASTDPAPAPLPVIRYMHPANRQLTWSGEGEVPEWITAYLARGGSWMAMENTAAKLAPQRRMRG